MNAEMMKAEANERMQILSEMGYWKEAADEFICNGTVFCSEKDWVYPLRDFNFELAGVIDEFEKAYGAVVYATIFNVTFQVPRLIVLFVGADAYGWESDKSDLWRGFPFACAINLLNRSGDWNNVNIHISPTGGLSAMPVY